MKALKPLRSMIVLTCTISRVIDLEAFRIGTRPTSYEAILLFQRALQQRCGTVALPRCGHRVPE